MHQVILVSILLVQSNSTYLDQPVSGNEVFHARTLGEKLNYQIEVTMPDGSRCDLISPTHAIEVEWSNKWQESIGQATLYSIWTNKEPSVYLLVKDWRESRMDLLRCKLVCERLKINLVIVKVNP